MFNASFFVVITYIQTASPEKPLHMHSCPLVRALEPLLGFGEDLLSLEVVSSICAPFEECSSDAAWGPLTCNRGFGGAMMCACC
jgi:hypothetical protein